MKDQKTNELMHTLVKCATACNTCAVECLSEDNASEMERCIRLDLDCADICQTAINFVGRNSEHATHIMKECIEICNECARECEKHDAEHCKHCAEICHECAEACENWVNVSA